MSCYIIKTTIIISFRPKEFSSLQFSVRTSFYDRNAAEQLNRFYLNRFYISGEEMLGSYSCVFENGVRADFILASKSDRQSGSDSSSPTL